MSSDLLWVLEMEKHVQPCAFHQFPRDYKNPQRPYIHHDQTEIKLCQINLIKFMTLDTADKEKCFFS